MGRSGKSVTFLLMVLASGMALSRAGAASSEDRFFELSGELRRAYTEAADKNAFVESNSERLSTLVRMLPEIREDSYAGKDTTILFLTKIGYVPDTMTAMSELEQEVKRINASKIPEDLRRLLLQASARMSNALILLRKAENYSEKSGRIDWDAYNEVKENFFRTKKAVGALLGLDFHKAGLNTADVCESYKQLCGEYRVLTKGWEAQRELNESLRRADNKPISGQHQQEQQQRVIGSDSALQLTLVWYDGEKQQKEEVIIRRVGNLKDLRPIGNSTEPELVRLNDSIERSLEGKASQGRIDIASPSAMPRIEEAQRRGEPAQVLESLTQSLRDNLAQATKFENQMNGLVGAYRAAVRAGEYVKARATIKEMADLAQSVQTFEATSAELIGGIDALRQRLGLPRLAKTDPALAALARRVSGGWTNLRSAAEHYASDQEVIEQLLKGSSEVVSPAELRQRAERRSRDLMSEGKTSEAQKFSQVSGLIGGQRGASQGGPGREDASGVRGGQQRITGAYVATTRQSAQGVVSRYGSIPGGVILEGEGSGVEPPKTVRYDAKANAFILDERVVYFSPVAAAETASILRAVHLDERLGVSLGGVDITFGALEPLSKASLDLKVVDLFLAEFVFASGHWTRDYRFAAGYAPKQNTTAKRSNLTVFFNFKDFDFSHEGDDLRLSHSNFVVTLVPLAERTGRERGHFPDYDAIDRAEFPKAYEENARHLGENIAYYKDERLVALAFKYGELAAFARALKRHWTHLELLAEEVIRKANGGSADFAMVGCGENGKRQVPFFETVCEQGGWSIAQLTLLDRSSVQSVVGENKLDAMSADASFSEAEGHRYGKRGKIDIGEAHQLFAASAAGGNGKALAALGSLYRLGLGVPQSEALARRLFVAAAEKGNHETSLVYYLLQGIGGESDRKAAAQWDEKEVAELRGKAARVDPWANVRLGYKYHYGSGTVAKDKGAAASLMQKAIRLLEKLAEESDEKPLSTLCHVFQEGIGVPKDTSKASAWCAKYLQSLRIKAEKGEYQEIRLLAYAYQYGNYGAKVDGPKAVSLFEQLAGRGDAEAMASLGHMYRFGKLVRESSKDAADWYEKAARIGHIGAAEQLGSLLKYDVDRTVAKTAVKWYRRAALGGSLDAMRNLGEMYLEGRLVEHNAWEGRYWLLAAANRGDGQAMVKLGDYYKSANEKPEEVIELGRALEMFHWYEAALAYGHTERSASNKLAAQFVSDRAFADVNKAAECQLRAQQAAYSDWEQKDQLELLKKSPEYVRKEVQKVLKQRGLYSGQANGNIDDATTKAISELRKMESMRCTVWRPD